MGVVAAVGDLLITVEYNDAVAGEPGMEWAILHDNTVLSWVIDETGATPPVPVIFGTMPGEAPATGDILSPSWAVRNGATIFIPDMARGSANEFFNFIATNNGAHRPLYTKFADTALATEFQQWAGINPTLALKDPPNVAPDEDLGLESRRLGGMDDQRPPDVRRADSERRAADRKRAEEEAKAREEQAKEEARTEARAEPARA